MNLTVFKEWTIYSFVIKYIINNMKILFIGHYGGRNIGDEIILLSQMQFFEKYFNRKIKFIVSSYDEDFTINLYKKYG